MVISETREVASNRDVSAVSERRLLPVLALTLLPWIVVVLFTAEIWAAVNFLAYILVVVAAGYSILNAAVPAAVRYQPIVFAPAAGILAISGLTALWVRLGLPLIWSMGLWLALAAVGLVALWRDRVGLAKGTVSRGLTLVLLSTLICTVYFLPSARNDLVQGRDGSFKWMFIDSQHFHAIAASIKDSEGPPRTPGTVTGELLYHFGPYAPAAAISLLDSLDLGDAVARVTRGASLWALVLSCFGLGTLLSIRATGKGFGGIMSVAGLFFYGSLLSLLNDETTTLGRSAKAIVFNIPRMEVQGDGGPFNQLLGGHSVLHGLIAITVIMGLCLIGRDRKVSSKWDLALLALPALAVPMNLEVSLYCFGVTGILLFWGRLRNPWSWASILLMLGLFFAAWSIMGVSHSSDAAQAIINRNPLQEWWSISVWLIVGLGFRLTGFRWISRSFKDPVSVLVLISVIGWLAFDLGFQLRDENQRYGIYFLQSVFSILAFSRLSPGCWRGAKRSQMIAEWLRDARGTMAVLLGLAVIFRTVVFLMHSHAWGASLRLQILPLLLLLSLITGTLVYMKRSAGFSRLASAVCTGVLLIGFLGWLPTWLRFGLQLVPTDVTYLPGEASGLRHLKEVMAPNERFATNKHDIDRLNSLPPLALSYGYSALAEHPVLLEGYLARGEKSLPWFNSLYRDNELLFTTTDPETLRETAKIWQVRWLVAKPGTDIAIPKPLPPWLVEQKDSGTLKVYRID